VLKCRSTLIKAYQNYSQHTKALQLSFTMRKYFQRWIIGYTVTLKFAGQFRLILTGTHFSSFFVTNPGSIRISKVAQKTSKKMQPFFFQIVEYIIFIFGTNMGSKISKVDRVLANDPQIFTSDGSRPKFFTLVGNFFLLLRLGLVRHLRVWKISTNKFSGRVRSGPISNPHTGALTFIYRH